MVTVNFPNDTARELEALLAEHNINVPKGVSVELLHALRADCRHSSWYGGEMIAIRRGGRKLVIAARGDVQAVLLDKHTGRQLFQVNDKTNTGELGFSLWNYVQSDQGLRDIADGNHPDYQLQVESNNWWEFELWIPGRDSQNMEHVSSFCCCADSDDLFQSILEAMDPEFDWWDRDL